MLSRKSRLLSNRELKRAAVDRGHSVKVLDPVNLHFSIKDGEGIIYDRSRKLGKFDAMIPRIQPEDAHGMASIEHFVTTGCFVLNRAEGVRVAHDKFATLQALASAGIRVPDTVLLKHPLSVKIALKDIGGPPAVFKALYGAQGMGVVLVNSESEADSLVGLGWEWNQPCMLQKFHPESNGEDIRLIVVGGEVVASMKRVARKGEWRANFHRGGKGGVYEPSRKEIGIAKKSAKVIGLNFCGVDLIHTDDGPLVLEVNASPGLQEITRATGVDVAGAVIRFIE